MTDISGVIHLVSLNVGGDRGRLKGCPSDVFVMWVSGTKEKEQGWTQSTDSDRTQPDLHNVDQ